MQALLDRGYSYNIMSEPVLKLDNAVVRNGVLAPEGPGYRALIIKDAAKMSVTVMEKVLDYTGSGLPVIFYNSDITRVYGTDKSDNNDAALQSYLNELMGLDNVSTAATEEEILSILSRNGISPAASYSQSGLEASHRLADEGLYLLWGIYVGTKYKGAYEGCGLGCRCCSNRMGVSDCSLYLVPDQWLYSI